MEDSRFTLDTDRQDGPSSQDFAKESEEVVQKIQSLKSNWQQLKRSLKTVNQNSYFDDIQVSRLKELQVKTDETIYSTKNDLRRLSLYYKRSDKKQKLLMERFKSEFQSIQNDYKSVQVEMKNLLSQLKNHENDSEQERESIEIRDLRQSFCSIISLEILRIQELELSKIENDISDIKDIMEIISKTVEDQRDDVDKVESHTYETVEFIESGTENLRQAHSVSNSRRKKIICISLIFVVLIILLIIGLVFLLK